MEKEDAGYCINLCKSLIVGFENVQGGSLSEDSYIYEKFSKLASCLRRG